ncbi:hypothetical protein LEP1GSC188_0122 [Leptospira weilii serovar Topaz str. LT2116]|uniref:Uncharacterized protein n=1 Tax=Leptospira weilii serovar Topaz str. LT2116 TaxID=1088540 RepID=M3H0G6_9LEPT|nr:hypothetical protein LEP1GSC188_0122 [Leptospira weilii serovar Topaz str. LT2116]
MLKKRELLWAINFETDSPNRARKWARKKFRSFFTCMNCETRYCIEEIIYSYYLS